MPSVNGIQLAERLMNMYLDIPIILITSTNDLDLIRHALKMGVIDYLIKPINVQELPLVVEKNLERKRLESQRLQENKAEILLKALKALMRALDAKDPYTAGHSHRVAALAMLMARELSLKTEEQYSLQLAALLHDIGKIGMPDSILNKSASLKDYEFDIAKDHPVVGSQIIGEIEELSEVASAVRHHHERFDGSGYPDGLKGEAIPFFARILSIIDTYEALVSNRVYRKATDKDQALAEIQNYAGIQFDPELVKIFVKMMDHVSENDEMPKSEKSFSLSFSNQRRAKEAI
jgi:putative two-component system response regulator